MPAWRSTSLPKTLILRLSPGRLSADIQAVVATHYSRNLREEVKKGLYGRLKQGFCRFARRLGISIRAGQSESSRSGSRRRSSGKPLRCTAQEVLVARLAEEMFRRGLRNHNGGPVSHQRLGHHAQESFLHRPDAYLQERPDVRRQSTSRS